MAKPLVAIVGRPNVGKSTFFNQMAGRRIAIVEDTPGVTRDRVYVDCEWQKYKFTLIDTGGIDPLSDDPLLSQMRRQAEIAIGSGGNFALAAARALYENTDLSAQEIAGKALKIASDICVYTNSNIIVETV